MMEGKMNDTKKIPETTGMENEDLTNKINDIICKECNISQEKKYLNFNDINFYHSANSLLACIQETK